MPAPSPSRAGFHEVAAAPWPTPAGAASSLGPGSPHFTPQKGEATSSDWPGPLCPPVLSEVLALAGAGLEDAKETH